MENPTSERLTFKRVDESDFEVLHSLITDSHVKEYLLNGENMSREWSLSVIRDSQALFQTQGVGVWVLSGKDGREPLGFCGFRFFPRYGNEEPELLYAFREAHTGKGLATECTQAMISFVKEHTQKKRIESAVDSPNLASKKILERVGFQKTGEIEGDFGPIITYELVFDA